MLPATELEERLNERMSTLKDRVRINGFRPGKVPVGHLRKVYGRSVMADVLQNAVNEANRKIVEDNGLKLANEPQVQFPETRTRSRRPWTPRATWPSPVALEVLPVFELADLSDVTVKKPVAEVSDAEINESLERMAKQNRSFETKDGEAETGDRVVVDFVAASTARSSRAARARTSGSSSAPTPSSRASRTSSSASRPGDTKLVKVTFPANYMAAHLAGKDAEFDVTVKEVEAPGELKIDDEMAKGFGMESLDKLKDAIRDAIKRDFDAQSRRKVKKELLDALDAKYSFELPPTLVEQEFAAVWSQVVGDMKSNNRTFEDEEHHRGRGQGRVPQDRRAPRASRFGPCADR